jgi:hypothetical protein
LLALPLFGDRKPLPYLQTTFAETEGRFSPNGRWVAYESRESGDVEVYVASFPTPAIKRRVSANGGRSPRWHHEGRELFFLDRTNTLMAAAIEALPSGLNVGAAKALFETRPAHPSWALSADSQRFLVNTAPDDSTTVPLTLFINWTATLPTRAP